jgi:cytochrome c biogenesis protein CcdA
MGTSARRRLPRAIYWVAGAAIAFTGAVGARVIAEGFPLEARVPIWLAGAAIIFLGLCILSLGTRSHLDDQDDQRHPE